MSTSNVYVMIEVRRVARNVCGNKGLGRRGLPRPAVLDVSRPHLLAAAEPHPAADLEPAALQPDRDAAVRRVARDRAAERADRGGGARTPVCG